MSMTAEEMMAGMKAGLKDKTGKPLEDWVIAPKKNTLPGRAGSQQRAWAG